MCVEEVLSKLKQLGIAEAEAPFPPKPVESIQTITL